MKSALDARDRRGRQRLVADSIGQLDRRPRIVDPEAKSGEHLFVHSRVKICEATGEWHLLAVHRHRTKRAAPPRLRPRGQIGRIARQHSLYRRALKLETAGSAAARSNRDFGADDLAEEPEEHVEEVNTDIDDESARALLGTFSRHVIPPTARGDVGKGHVMVGARRRGRYPALQLRQRRMMPELGHGVDAPVAFVLELLKHVKVPRVDDQRLFADSVGPDAERKTDMRIVQIVRRADADLVSRTSGSRHNLLAVVDRDRA